MLKHYDSHVHEQLSIGVEGQSAKVAWLPLAN